MLWLQISVMSMLILTNGKVRFKVHLGVPHGGIPAIATVNFPNQKLKNVTDINFKATVVLEPLFPYQMITSNEI